MALQCMPLIFLVILLMSCIVLYDEGEYIKMSKEDVSRYFELWEEGNALSSWDK